MLLSLWVYSLSAILLCILARNISIQDVNSINKYGHRSNIMSLEFALSLLLFACLAGMRYNVGVDYNTYMGFYIDYQNQGWIERESLESGFNFIMKAFARSGIHYAFFFALWGALQFFFVYYALKEYKQILPFIAITIMLGPYFLEWMNGIRQSVVCCLFLYISKYIVNKQFLKYLIWVLLGCLIHKSALLLIPLYFIFYFDVYLKYKYINILILIICAVVGTTPTFVDLFSSSEWIFELLGYDKYAENLDLIMEDTRSMEWGPIRFLLFFRDVLIIWFYPKVRLLFSKDKWINLLFNMFFIGTCLYNLLVINGIIFTRPLMYLRTPGLLLIAFTLYCLFRERNKFPFIIFSVFSLSYIFVEHAKMFVQGITDSVILYKFFFMI